LHVPSASAILLSRVMFLPLLLFIIFDHIIYVSAILLPLIVFLWISGCAMFPFCSYSFCLCYSFYL
jgi:hypothetical protein